MPYIKKKEKIELIDRAPITSGELNYILTTICKRYYLENGARYQQINDIIGALEGCKLEFYRRIVSPYEDFKIKENDDVY